MPVNEQPNLTSQTLRGLQWTYAEVVVSFVLQIVVAGILARLLDPAAFGVVAVAVLTMRFVDQASKGGLSQAIIQKPDLTDLDIRTGFGLSLAFGAFFGVVVVLLAPLAARVFDDPSAAGVVRWMALSIPLTNAGAVAEGLLRRDLRFQALAQRNVASYVVGYAIVGVGLAQAGVGVGALVAATLSQTGLRTLLAWVAVRHSLVPSLDRTAARGLLSFGGRISVIGFLEFLGTELDTLAVGRFLGVSTLGLYNRAYLLVEVPLHQLNNSLSTVIFPALSRVQGDTPRLREAYLSSVRVSSSLLLPVSAGIAVAASEIIGVILGEQWIGAVEVVPWMAVAGGIGTVTHFAGITAEAKAALTAKIKVVVVKVVVLAVALWVVRDQPLWAFGAAIFVAALVTHVGYTAIAARVTEATIGTVVAAYARSVPAALVVAAAIGGVRFALVDAGAPQVVTLIAEVVTGGLALLALLRWGLLRSTTRDLALRLTNAGMLQSGTSVTRLFAAVFGARNLPAGIT